MNVYEISFDGPEPGRDRIRIMVVASSAIQAIECTKRWMDNKSKASDVLRYFEETVEIRSRGEAVFGD